MIYYFFLVLALAVGGLGLFVRRRSEEWGRAMMIAGVLGCAGCVAWQVRHSVFAPASSGPDRGQAVVAYYLAQQVLREVGNQQGLVLLLFPPENVFDDETVGTYAGTFSRVMRGLPTLNVQTVRLAGGGRAALQGQIPMAAFQQALSNTPPAVACVSFAGTPPEIEKLLPRGSPGPHLFVFDPWGTTNWLAALKKGRIHAVIVPRPGVESKVGAEIAGEPSEVFARLYLMATPSTGDQIAAQLGRR